MIPLREDATSGMTVKEFVKQMQDIYHAYFPKSHIVIGRAGHYFDITPYLSDGGRFLAFPDAFQADTDINILIYTDGDDLRSRDENARVGNIIDSVFGNYAFSKKKHLSDFHAGWYEEVKGVENPPENTSPEAFLEWFDNFCSKLYKATKKMWRKGHLSKEYKEYVE